MRKLTILIKRTFINLFDSAPAAILALSSISSSPVPQTFVILSGIFALFGLVYTLSLALHIGESKMQFLAWFVRNGHRWLLVQVKKCGRLTRM